MKELRCAKAKITFWRVLKVAFYMLGIPLLHYFVRLSVQGYPGGHAGSADKLLLALNIIWVFLALVQIFAALVAKTKRARAFIVGIVATVLMLAPLVYIQVIVKNDYNERRDELAEQGIKIDTWEDQVYNYSDNAKDLNKAYDKYTDYYNIDYESDVYGGTNADGSEYEQTKKDDGDDAYYSPNGMYADGYIFGYKQARWIHETYFDYRAACKANGEDADAKLAAAIAELETNPNSAWNKYKKTDEYLAAYGKDGTATKHYITEERLDAILSTVGREIDKTELKQALQGAMSVLGGMIPADIPVAAILNALDENLSMAVIEPIISSFGLSADTIYALLGEYSYYQSPTTHPVFYFIADEDLAEYALVCYYGKVHGATVGSILISDTAVGEVTFSETGNEPLTEKELREIFADIDEGESYAADFLPYFTVLEYLYYFAGVVPCAFFLSYMASEMEKRTFNKYLQLKEGDK